MRGSSAFGLAVAVSLIPATLFAQRRPVSWVAAASPTIVRPGSVFQVHLAATIDRGWHMYSVTQGPGGPIPTRVTLPAEQPFTLAGSVQSPRPETKFDQSFGIMVESFSDSVRLVLPVLVSTGIGAGKQELNVHLRYQVCNATVCLPPYTERLVVPLTIRSATP